jgi:hypothetical protein
LLGPRWSGSAGGHGRNGAQRRALEYCAPAPLPWARRAAAANAEALLVGNDGVAITANETNSYAAATGVATGLGSAASFPVTGTCAGCNASGNYTLSALIANWGALFNTSCASTSNCPSGLTHAWRHGDLSGTTDALVCPEGRHAKSAAAGWPRRIRSISDRTRRRRRHRRRPRHHHLLPRLQSCQPHHRRPRPNHRRHPPHRRQHRRRGRPRSRPRPCCRHRRRPRPCWRHRLRPPPARFCRTS